MRALRTALGMLLLAVCSALLAVAVAAGPAAAVTTAEGVRGGTAPERVQQGQPGSSDRPIALALVGGGAVVVIAGGLLLGRRRIRE